jgi:hypothetical protein
MRHLAQLLSHERPDLLLVEARSARQPTLEATIGALDRARLPMWLSIPGRSGPIEWLESRGRRTREIDAGLLEITRW